MFVPGHEGFDDLDSRTGAVLDRILAMDEIEVRAAFDDVIARFGRRHRKVIDTFRDHALQVAERLDPPRVMSRDRQLLLGATFTSEYAIEGAAVCNPSLIPHPDQRGVPAGAIRFVMSFRAVGEGHRSSIGFRTGTVDRSGRLSIDARSPLAMTGTVTSVPLEASVFRNELRRLGSDGEDTDYVLHPLGPRFTVADLEVRLSRVRANLATRRRGVQTIALARAIAERSYGVTFPADTSLPERVLWPAMGAESVGMEDARFVRFTHDDGSVVYYAPYTAYDGGAIRQQLLETTDFATFSSAPLVGQAAANKGLALFPRRIHGRYAALSRCDRETNSIAFSDDLRAWTTSAPCQVPARAWQVLQLGNCGSPIETADGWLVLTHGVGPMRTYSIGAMLLDLDDPTRVVASSDRPILSPGRGQQSGYVPNVVYSCGALAVGDRLVLPYGVGDQTISFASLSISDLLDEMRRGSQRQPSRRA
jgi:predicted GH43/DUF377 family glycosyl hydrolase